MRVCIIVSWEITLIWITDFRLSCWFIVVAYSAVEPLQFMYVVLPTFRRYILRLSSGSNCMSGEFSYRLWFNTHLRGGVGCGVSLGPYRDSGKIAQENCRKIGWVTTSEDPLPRGPKMAI
jgi:hypothetical protein